MNETNLRQMEADIEWIEKELQHCCRTKPETNPQGRVLEAMRYSLEAGGKRIRPLLVLAFCRACGGDVQKALKPALAIEMIHTYSLIHDDLPAMDNDDYRRGRLSCHKAFDEATAILAGDALNVLPFELLAADTALPAETRVSLIAELANAAGPEGMIGGQVIDIANETRRDVDKDNLVNMYAHKTGALIRVACTMGCMVAGANDKMLTAATEYAQRLGLAFQIVDDILDVTGTPELLGKPIGSDAANNKTTFVTLLGLEGAKAEASRLTEEALCLLEDIPEHQFLKELTEALLNRNY
ncbi:polyprenyl synthetase family protein [Ruminococcus sp.]|uniref:polyprenyl synthetase family protein n=1 Tax=Ruminococcus sp. TaxID=41978 RepID=UPI0025D2869C|nr:farnesyl diphosphate synthase [Ruminococcus sp.]MCI5816249.1 polyprenyl synthetase family protein [Ruminococcus sp.]MDD7556631.1 polyprenyl synthetase family protein [Ruminococcus sp.]MDY4964605.1 farnesyl diphosphate synthase [Ruminococcus callidus]